MATDRIDSKGRLTQRCVQGARETVGRWTALMLASVLLPWLAGCQPGADGGTPSGAVSQQIVDPAPPRGVPGDSPETASRRSAPALEPEHIVGAAESEETEEGETLAFVLEAERDLQSLDLKASHAGEVRLPPLLLTADIAKVPLKEVLPELGREIRAKVYVADTVPDEPISVKFEKLPVEEGIQRILKGKSYTLVRKKQPALPDTKKGGRGGGSESSEELIVAEIHVLSRDPKVRLEAAQMKEVTNTERRAAETAAFAKKALEAGTAKERLAALEKFLRRADPSQLTDVLVPALKDSDPKIRGLALDRIGDGGDVPPLEPIVDIALTDESPKLRASAMGSLVSIHGPMAAMPTLKRALNDPDPRIQKVAADTLERAERIQQHLEQYPLAP